MDAVADSFWSKVDRRSACWQWTAHRDKRGYGKFRQMLAHRIAWALTNGTIPPGMCVCHACDNPPCVNPSHLFLGTRTDNMRDMVTKGRSAAGDRNGARIHRANMRRGEASCQAVLSDDDVIDIRTVLAIGANRADVSRAYGVNWGTINSIMKRSTWRHLP